MSSALGLDAFHVLGVHAREVKASVERTERRAGWCTDDPCRFVDFDKLHNQLLVRGLGQIPEFAVRSASPQIQRTKSLDVQISSVIVCLLI